ncbi:hypothetical protein NF681_11550 [Comamonadaceae bacterium OTU4NAUVB1]|nr:hypothetical protein NF681_11550 [Comamonadaceae bacterium OTU4NAUVB1]
MQNKKQSAGNSSNNVDLVGEGVVVPFKLHGMSNQGSLTRATAVVDLSGAAAPTRKFVADCFEIRKEFGEYRLLFGQRKVDGKSLRAMLDVRFPIEPMPGMAATVYAGIVSIPLDEKLQSINYLMEFLEEPEQSIALAANFTRTNAGPGATTMDFFNSSGLALANFFTTQKLFTDPVVRLTMPNPMMLQFSKELEKIVPKNIAVPT